MIQRGDRVRLTKRVAATVNDRPNGRSDWFTRVGTCVRVSKVADKVFIKWDDRVSTDDWPQRAVEKVP